MAYTRPWSEVLNLLGTRDSDEIDDASREAKVDLGERFADIVQDVEADPWVLKQNGTGVDGSYNVRIPAAGGMIISGLIFDPALGAVKPTGISVSGKWVAAIQVPRTMRVMGAVFTVMRATAPGSVTAKIVQVQGGSGGTAVVNVLATDVAPSTVSVIQGVILDGLDEEIGDNNDIFFEVDIVGDGVAVENNMFYAVNVNLTPKES